MADNQDPKGGDNQDPKGQGGQPQTPQPVPYDRFKEVNDQKAALEKWKADREKADAEAEAKKLADQGKHKELADQKAKEAEEAKSSLNSYIKTSELKVAGLQAGCLDPDTLAKVVDLTSIEVKDGKVDAASIKAIVEKAKTEKPYLFGEAKKPDMGGQGGAPQGGGKPVTYTREQLRDAKFFQEHRDDIMKAMAEGRITG